MKYYMETKIHMQEALARLELIAGKALMSEKICLIYVKFSLVAAGPAARRLIRFLAARAGFLPGMAALAARGISPIGCGTDCVADLEELARR